VDGGRWRVESCEGVRWGDSTRGPSSVAHFVRSSFSPVVGPWLVQQGPRRRLPGNPFILHAPLVGTLDGIYRRRLCLPIEEDKSRAGRLFFFSLKKNNKSNSARPLLLQSGEGGDVIWSRYVVRLNHQDCVPRTCSPHRNIPYMDQNPA